MTKVIAWICNKHGMVAGNRFLDIVSSVTDRGLSFTFKKQPYTILYGKEYWNATPEQTRIALRDNLALATTMHLPIVFSSPRITYDTPRAMLMPHFFENFVRDIPSCTEVDGTDTNLLMQQFFNTKYLFTKDPINQPSDVPVADAERAIIGMSFGKDSLLTYAVAQELGLDPEIVYIVEESMTYEEKHKSALGEQWAKEFGKQMHILHHDTGKLRDYNHLGLPFSEFGWGLQTTEYALEMIPFAYKLNGRYLLFGNEQTASETYMDEKGEWTVYPCYDQSHEWTVQIDQITQRFSGDSIQTGSLIEPLMDMMVQRTLVHRYPEIAKYQMSCFTETEAGRDYRWCHSCGVCAKMYLLCVGSGMDPSDVGFKENMLDGTEKVHHFTLFGGKSKLTYANTATARNEQLFAFYSAAKKGAKGSLVEKFKGSELFEEAKEREDELFKTYISLYEPISVPPELKDAVMSIYKEEIGSFEL